MDAVYIRESDHTDHCAYSAIKHHSDHRDKCCYEGSYRREKTYMKMIQEEISEYASLKGIIHEPLQEMPNVNSFPVMLVLPGGGFRFCSQREGEPVAMAFYAEGYSVFVLDYTTVTKKPDAKMEDPMEDVQRTLQWIHDHAGQYHLNPDKIGMLGFSGGGHLAAAAATHGPMRPNALILGYPGIVHSDLRALECPDIIERVNADTPPAFIFSTRDDQVTPPVHPLSFASALSQAGIGFELHIFNKGVHGLSLAKPFTCSGFKENVNPVFAQWFPLCIRWLTEELGDFAISNTGSI